MLRIPVLLNKLRILVKGHTIVDLTRASIKWSKSVAVKNAIQITADLAMRPDIIAKVAYGDSGLIDYILKFNGISNPFSIQEGDVLFIPESDDMKLCFIGRPPEIYPGLNLTNAAAKGSAIISVQDLSKKDQKRLEYLKKIATDAVVTPNEAMPGSSEAKIRNGVIVFGEDNTKQECKEPISRVKLKEKLLQKSIFKNS